MALQCGSNFFGGSGSHEQPIRRGQTGVAVAIALSLAFAKAWAAISADYAEKCPDTCKRKTGQVGLKVTSSIANNRVTFTFAYILLVRCSPTGRDAAEPLIGNYDELAELAPPPISGRRGRVAKRRGRG